jgi:N-acetylmuramic acid 6-phosphate etherase
MVQGIIAGGGKAVFRAIEGAEDRDGSGEISAHGVSSRDVVVGIAACGRTRFVRTALREARKRGSQTVLVASNPPTKDDPPVDVRISVVVGPEVIAGSTRMKAGTAAKMVLNMLSTASMVKIGKTYGNLMVDLTAKSLKLRDRAARIVMHLTGLSRARAEVYLKMAKGNAKVATVMARRGVGYKDALALLKNARGFLRGVLDSEQNVAVRREATRSGKTDR